MSIQPIKTSFQIQFSSGSTPGPIQQPSQEESIYDPHTLRNIFKFLPWHDRKNVALVSKTFRKAVNEAIAEETAAMLPNIFRILPKKSGNNTERPSMNSEEVGSFITTFGWHRMLDLINDGLPEEYKDPTVHKYSTKPQLRQQFLLNLCLNVFISEQCEDTHSPDAKAVKKWITDNASRITSIDMPDKNVRMLSSGIGILVHLQHLRLHNNKLQSFPLEIMSLSELHHLYLEANALTALPHEISRLSKLKTLNLRNNLITELPAEIGDLSMLQNLFLGINRLQRLPPEIGNLTKLQRLDIGSNQLQKLTSKIGNLTGLQLLDLGNNLLTELPSTIGTLSCLEKFYINNNLLSKIPKKIGNLSNLKWLYLDFNRLKNISKKIGTLPQLSSISMVENPDLKISKDLADAFQKKGTTVEL